jgi:heptosyltransferase II
VKDFCALATWSGAEIETETPSLDLSKNGQSSSEYAVLHPGAAFGSAKRWLPERFAEVVQKFPNLQWKVIGSAEERERNSQLTAQMGKHVEDCTGKYSLPELAHVLAKARFVLCNDSGPMHLAAAVGAPVIALFGSTEPRHTGPCGESHEVIRGVAECSPCYLRECPLDLRCMKSITVETVQRSIEKVAGLAAKRE